MQPSTWRRRRTTTASIATLALVATLPAGLADADTAPRPTVDPAASASTVQVGIASPATSIPANVRPYRTRTSLTGTHEWFQQVLDDRVVFGGWYARHTELTSDSTTVWDGRETIRGQVATEPTVSLARATSAATATSRAAAHVTGSTLVVLPRGDGRGSARLAWQVHAATGEGATTTLVDARTGEVLKVIVDEKSKQVDVQERRAGTTYAVTGRGRVLDPNPVAELQDQTLRDRRDSDAAVPKSAYKTVRLPRLSRDHTLVGRWVRVTNSRRVTSDTDRYFFFRDNPKFEQVNAYYAVDAAQHYLQELGVRGANAHSQQVKVNAFAADNSYYSPQQDLIALGAGGVDDAEDVEVVWHEYGHAIQDDQVPDFGLGHKAASIGEGFGDYLAVTMSQVTARDTAKTPAACVADWDATSYTNTKPHCLRRTDTDKRFPEDLRHEVHADGEIWSRALWGMSKQLNRRTATAIIVEAQFWMHPRISMPGAARKTVTTAKRLYPESGRAQATKQVFIRRGILAPLETVRTGAAAD